VHMNRSTGPGKTLRRVRGEVSHTGGDWPGRVDWLREPSRQCV
jgi:hypothetical protein